MSKEPLTNDIVELTSTVYQFRGDKYPSLYSAECAKREWFEREAEKKKQELKKAEAFKALNIPQGTIINAYHGEFFFWPTIEPVEETMKLIARVLGMDEARFIKDYKDKVEKIKPIQWHLLRFDFTGDYPYVGIEDVDKVIQERVDEIKKIVDGMPEAVKEQFFVKLLQALGAETSVKLNTGISEISVVRAEVKHE